MSIRSFNLAGKYVMAANVAHEIKPITFQQMEFIKKWSDFLLAHKSVISLLLENLLESKKNFPKSLFSAYDLAIKHNRFFLIPYIFKYWILYYQRKVEQVLEVSAPLELTKKQLDQSVSFMSKNLIDSKFLVKPILNKNLVAGLRLETPYFLWDNSVRSKTNFIIKFLNGLAGEL